MKTIKKNIIVCIALVYLFSDIGLAFSNHHCNCHFKEQFSNTCINESCEEVLCEESDERCNCAQTEKHSEHSCNEPSANHEIKCCTIDFRYIKLDIPQTLSEGKNVIPIIAIFICHFNFEQIPSKIRLIKPDSKPDFLPTLLSKFFHSKQFSKTEPPVC